MANYFAILTNAGAAKLANAAALGDTVKLTVMAVGDGGGKVVTPDPAATKLVNEKRRAPLNTLFPDPLNPSQLVAEQIIPEAVGGWWIREVGLFDDTGTLIAIANCPDTYKPLLSEGSGRTQTIRMVLIVGSVSSVELKIDPAVVLATRKYVDDKVIEVNAYTDKAMDDHLADAHPHEQYAKEEEVGKALKALEEKVKINARPVLHRDWASCRAAIPIGEAPADGQIIENGRALYPDAWAAIQAGLVPVCTEAEWLATTSKRGCYTTGDGRTNFRVPDYNGKSDGALGAVVFRGDGKNAAPSGDIQADATRPIKAAIGAIYVGELRQTSEILKLIPYGNSPAKVGVIGVDPGANYTLELDTSKAGYTANEHRMVNVAGCWTIHLFGVVLNSGSVDAAAMATAIAGLSARVSTLESAVNARKSTCLVNAVGTGAPHETVITQLPATITKNSRYVLPNPYGNNTPVLCWAEINVSDVWSDTGFIFASGGYGVAATYVQGQGIVIQTGGMSLKAAGIDGGSGHGVDSTPTSAKCRVFICKLETA